MKKEEWICSRSTSNWGWKMVVSLHEGQRANALKIQLRLEDVASLYEGWRVNVLKVHQQLKLGDGGWPLWHEQSEQLTPGQVIRKTEYVNPGSNKRASLCWAKSILTLEWWVQWGTWKSRNNQHWVRSLGRQNIFILNPEELEGLAPQGDPKPLLISHHTNTCFSMQWQI